MSTESSQTREYLIILNLPADVINKVKAVKERFAEKFSVSPSDSGANISLNHYFLEKTSEAKIVDRLRDFCLTQKVFKVNLQNYSFFSPYALYINIPDKTKILELGKKIKLLIIKALNNPELKIETYNKPHITIARNLKPEQFFKVQSEYQNKSFDASFNADSITMLYKPAVGAEENYKWEGSYKFKFGGGVDEVEEQFSIF